MSDELGHGDVCPTCCEWQGASDDLVQANKLLAAMEAERDRLRSEVHEALIDFETESMTAGYTRLRKLIEEGGDG